jgi:hypothetical protein
MSTLPALKRSLRAQSEHHLRLAAMEDLRRRHPDATAAPYHPPGAVFWRWVFVPLYRRLPWSAKQRAMTALGMTAESHGWTAPDRRPGKPWRPPRGAS